MFLFRTRRHSAVATGILCRFGESSCLQISTLFQSSDRVAQHAITKMALANA